MGFRSQNGYGQHQGYGSNLNRNNNFSGNNNRPITSMSNEMSTTSCGNGNQDSPSWQYSPMQPFYSQVQQQQSQSENSSNTSALDQMFNFVLEIDVACLKLETKCLNTLLRLEVKCSMFGINKEISVLALVDGGSTHTLMSPDIMPNGHKKILLDPNSLWVKRRPHRINGILGGANSNCYIITADLAFKTVDGDDYLTDHEFVISGEIRSHQMILGRDFLKSKQITVDHGQDSMTVEESDKNIVINFFNANKVSDLSRKESCGSDLGLGLGLGLETDAKDRYSALSEQIQKLQKEMNSLNVNQNVGASDNWMMDFKNDL